MIMYKIAYIDEQESARSNFYSHFKNDYEVVIIDVTKEDNPKSIVEKCFDNNIDAIIVDYNLQETGIVNFNGDLIIDIVKNTKPFFPIIILTSYSIDAIDNIDNVHIIYDKEALGGSESQFKILNKKIKTAISDYYKKIGDTNTRIEELIEKRNNQGLDIAEEEELTKLYILFDELNPEGKDLPANLIHRDSISKLNEFVNETKEILEQLKKLNQKK